MMSALDELGDIIRKQQQLRDKTFRQGQDKRRDRQRGQRGQGDQMGDLRQDQQGLKRPTQQTPGAAAPARHQRVRTKGQQGEGNEMGQLGEAGEAMGQAEGQLGEGDADSAVDSQGRALEACARAHKDWRNRCSNKAWGPGRTAGPAAGRRALNRTPIRLVDPCAAATTATT